MKNAARAVIAATQTLERAHPADQPEAALCTAAAARLLALYRVRIDKCSGSAEAVVQEQREEGMERALRLAALRAERSTLFCELRTVRLGSRTTHKRVRQQDLMEARQITRSGCLGLPCRAESTPAWASGCLFSASAEFPHFWVRSRTDQPGIDD